MIDIFTGTTFWKSNLVFAKIRVYVWESWRLFFENLTLCLRIAEFMFGKVGVSFWKIGLCFWKFSLCLQKSEFMFGKGSLFLENFYIYPAHNVFSGYFLLFAS